MKRSTFNAAWELKEGLRCDALIRCLARVEGALEADATIALADRVALTRATSQVREALTCAAGARGTLLSTCDLAEAFNRVDDRAAVA